MSINKVIALGHIGKIEQKFMPNGKAVVEIHMLSHFNHGNYTKIEGSSKDGFMLTILEKVA